LNKSNIDIYNIDLIYGLENQTRKSFIDDLKILVDKNVPEFTLYHLRANKTTNITNQNFENQLLMFSSAREYLLNEGYHQTRPLHFVRTDYVLKSKKYNSAPTSDQRESNDKGFVLGFGSSAISQIGDYLFENNNGLTKYISTIKENTIQGNKQFILSKEDNKIRYIIQNLTQKGHLDIKKYNKKFKQLPVKLNLIKKISLIEEKEDSLKLTEDGWLCADLIERYLYPTTKNWESRNAKYESVHNISTNDFNQAIKSLKLKEKEIVLDLMGGYGTVTEHIIKQYPITPLLMDISNHQLTKSKIKDKINSDSMKIPLKDNSINKIILKMGIHEVKKEEQYKIIKECYRILKPKGIISTWDMIPTTKKEQLLLQDILRKKDELSGFSDLVKNRYFFRKDELYDYYLKASFKEINSYHEFYFHLHTKNWLSSDLDNNNNKLQEWNDYIRERANIPSFLKLMIVLYPKMMLLFSSFLILYPTESLLKLIFLAICAFVCLQFRSNS